MHIRSVAAFGLFLMAAALPAHALTNEVVHANIPFAFHVCNTALPPGDYVIRPAGDTDAALLLLRRSDGSHPVFLLTTITTPKTESATAHLVFNRYGQERFLHAIFVPGGGGNVLLGSATESQAARGVASASETTHGRAHRVSRS